MSGSDKRKTRGGFTPLAFCFIENENEFKFYPMKKTMLWGFFLFLLFPFCTLGQGIDFSELSLDEALQVAQRENKKVFIDFYTVWCGPCKQLSRDVFPQKAVGDYFNPRFISLKCDAEKGDGPALARKYGVRAYPTLVFLDAKGELLYSFAGASDAATLIERVQRGLDENLSPERLQARYAGGERTPELIYYYAISLFENGKDQDAYAVIEDYFAHLSEQEKCSEENFKIYERYILNLDHPIARYVLAHYPQFFATVGEERTRVLLRKWLWQATMPYVIVRENTSLSLAAFCQLQQDIAATGLNTGSYPAMLQLGEYKMLKQWDKYLDYCFKHFPEFSSSERFLILINLESLSAEPAAIKAKAVRLLEDYLPSIDERQQTPLRLVLKRLKTEPALAE